MPKKKTHQATAKRFKITKTGKFMKRTAGQDHFNSRESSNTTMGKRRDTAIADVNVKALRQMIPGA
jgi:large subunit ribosomal protein L35